VHDYRNALTYYTEKLRFPASAKIARSESQNEMPELQSEIRREKDPKAQRLVAVRTLPRALGKKAQGAGRRSGQKTGCIRHQKA
jgi:hypothetical protein